MNKTKESKFSFSGEGKESISDRLRYLIGTRSVRAAAQDWGLSFSTLNNYLSRGTEPSLNVAIKIASVERVSVEWLATGVSPEINNNPKPDDGKDSATQLTSAWNLAISFMDRRESEALLRILLSGGARGLIKLADHETSLEEALLLLPQEEKERLMALHEAKKGASEDGELDITPSPASDNKRQAS